MLAIHAHLLHMLMDLCGRIVSLAKAASPPALGFE
jgi:hypothetical protein